MKHTLSIALLCSVLCAHVTAQDMLLLTSTGKVVIGDTAVIDTPDGYSLYVQNGILTEKVKVSLHDGSDWKDDAWDHTPSLSDVAQQIVDKRHLIGMPSADHLAQHGYEVTDMDARLLEQIEWLWQHTIELSQQNAELQRRLSLLEDK